MEYLSRVLGEECGTQQNDIRTQDTLYSIQKTVLQTEVCQKRVLKMRIKDRIQELSSWLAFLQLVQLAFD